MAKGFLLGVSLWIYSFRDHGYEYILNTTDFYTLKNG